MWNFLQRLEKKIDDHTVSMNSLPKIEKSLAETNDKITAAVTTAKEAKKTADDAREESRVAERSSREAIAMQQNQNPAQLKQLQ